MLVGEGVVPHKCLRPGSRLSICELPSISSVNRSSTHPHSAPPTHPSSGNWVCGWGIVCVDGVLGVWVGHCVCGWSVGCAGGAFLSFVSLFPSHTERRTRLDSLTSPARGYTDSSVAQHPTSEHEASPSQSLVTIPTNAATKDMLLQSLMADPVTRTKMVAMLREDLTVARSSSYNTLGGNPSRRRTQTDSDTSLKWLSLEGRSRSLGTIGVGSIPPQPCSTTLQISDEPCQQNTTFSQISDDPPSQTSDDPPSQTSDDPPSQTSDDPPSQTSDDPFESRAAIHQTPTDPPQSHNINQQTPDGATFSPLSSEGQLRKESRESSSSQASSSLGVGSPVPLQSNSATKQQQCSSPMPSQQQCEGKLTDQL